VHQKVGSYVEELQDAGTRCQLIYISIDV